MLLNLLLARSTLAPNFKNQMETFQLGPYLTLLKHMVYLVKIITLSLSPQVFAQMPLSCLSTQANQFKIATLTPALSVSLTLLYYILLYFL